MNYFLKANKNLLTYSLILLLLIPIFGINFLISFLGNILLLLFLIPLLFLILVFVGFYSFKSKINVCNKCGAISLRLNETELRFPYKVNGKNELENNSDTISDAESKIKN